MNNLQLKTRVSHVCGVASSGADSVEEWQDVQDVVNEAVVDILSRTKINVRGVTINLLANEQEYDLGGVALRIYDLKHGTTELEEVMPPDIDESGSASFAILGFNRIMFGFVPQGGDSVVGWWTPAPTAMVADGDDPSQATWGAIPVMFHPAIVNYSCWKISDQVGDRDSGRGEKYRIYYEGKDGMGNIGSDLGKIKMAINLRGGAGAQQRRLRRSADRLLGDADPSAWTG